MNESKKPLRILFLTHEIPLPAHNGDRIYSLSILRELTRNGNYVHMVVFGRSGEKVATVPDDGQQSTTASPTKEFLYASRLTKVPFVAKKHSHAFFSFRPGMVSNRYSHHYICTVCDILNLEGPFDVIFVNHFKMAYLIEAIRTWGSVSPVILLTQNAEAILSKTVYTNHKNPIKKLTYYLDWLKMRRYEPKYLKQYDAVTGICPKDTDHFLRQYRLPNAKVLPPSINLEEYRAKLSNSTKYRNVIICGSFLWEPKRLNLLHLLNCTNFDSFSKNGITLKIVGNADPEFVKHVNATYQGVHMTGWVADVREHYSDCSVAIIPELMGGGFKMKIIEAVALKRAIVGLKGAVTASGFEIGKHFIEAQSMNELVEKAVALINEPNRIEFLTKNAHDLIMRKYSNATMQTKLMNIIRSVRA